MIGVQAQHAARSVHLASILRAQYSSGKISLPIDGGLYARFRHVQGVPSTSSGGYSISKLQMIDLMVERLVQLRGEPVSVPRPSTDAEAARVVESLAGDLHDAIRNASTSRGSYAHGIAETGLLLNMVA
ncbi:MAG: hypothetical protein ACOC1I_05155 [Spirochaetota bacterium]